MNTETVEKIVTSKKATYSILAKSIRNNKFIKSVVIVASGTAGAQCIAMAFSPILTRIYSPDAFGVLGTFLALVAVFSPVSALSFPIAIVIAKHDSEAKSVIKLAVLSALFIAGLLLIVVLSSGDWLLEKLKLQEIRPYIFLLPVVLILSAMQQITQQWAIRKKLFRIRAKVAIFQTLMVNLAKSFIGLVNPVSAVLIFVSVLEDTLQPVLLYLGIRKSKIKETGFSARHKIPLRLVLKKYSDFPVFRSSDDFFTAISQSLPVLMLTAYFGPASAGCYALCKKLLSMPSQLIGSSVGDVFYPHISEAANSGKNLSRIIIKATIALAATGFLPFLIIVVLGPGLFTLVFGAQWQTAGQYARWLSLWIFCMFINIPSIKAIPVLSAQRFLLAYTIPTLLLRTLSLAVGYHVFDNEIVSVALYSITGAIVNLLLIVIVLQKSHNYDLKRKTA